MPRWPHTLEERLEHRIDRDGPNGCWQWTGRLDRDGYGRIDYKRISCMAHRVMLISRGIDPEGMDVDHLCRNRRCVNPDHLEVVTRAENNRRMNRDTLQQRRGRGERARVTQCVHGHEYTPENTYTDPLGRRSCRVCVRRRVAKYQAKKNAEAAS